MTDSEKLEAIKQIVKEYVEDTDHWADYFMEKVVDVIYDKQHK